LFREAGINEPEPNRYIILPIEFNDDGKRNNDKEISEDKRFNDLNINVIRYTPKSLNHYEIEEILNYLRTLPIPDNRTDMRNDELQRPSASRSIK
jgi:hypothetical protein